MKNQPVNQFEPPANQQETITGTFGVSTRSILHLLVGGLVLTLVGSATAHRLQMGTDGYVGSWFQWVEILSLTAALVSLAIAALSVLVCLFLFKWTPMMLSLAYAAILFTAVAIAMWIDAPFLIYAT